MTDYGAVGDAQQVWVSTSAGSPVVSFTNALSAADIGKTIELFGVGQTNIGLNVNQIYVTNHQDLIAVITNVAGNNAYLCGEVPFVTSNSVYCLYGTNNANAFLACIAAAPTNAVIYIPHGTISPWGTTNAYLFVPYCLYTNYQNDYLMQAFCDVSLPLNRGGLTFAGDGPGQTILMGNGAYKNEETTNYPNTGNDAGWCARGFLFQAQPPITNDFPLVFTNLTMDGGLPNGLIGDEGYQPAIPVDGMGWDQTHHVFVDGPPGAPGRPESSYLNSLKIFSNCEFRHWRGEMLIGVEGGWGEQPGYIIITNCVFWDGNATAFNMNFAHTITDCTFSNMFQDEEFYVAYPTNASSWFVNNYTTNNLHAFISLNGGTATNQPYYISNNVFAAVGGNGVGGIIDGIGTTPAANLTIVNNTFICSNICSAIILNEPGEQGYFNNSNIWISGNSFSFYTADTLLLTYGGAFGVQNVTVSNNVLAANSMAGGYRPTILEEFGPATNVLFVDNNFSTPNSQVPWDNNVTTLSSGPSGGPYALVETNTTYQYQYNQFNFGLGTTSVVSYANGPWYQTSYTTPGEAIVLKDSDSNQIPPGAQMVLDNTTNFGPNNGIYTIYLNSARTRSQMTTNGQLNVFNWMPGIGWVNANGSAVITNGPTVNFTATPNNGIVPMTAQFRCPSVDSTGSTITGWTWNFGDGSTSTLQNPSHTYTNAGTFSPSLIFTNSNGIAGKGSGPVVAVNQVKLGLVIAARTMTLAWPTNAVGYALQYTTNLSPPVIWRPFLSKIVIIKGQYVTTSLMSGPQMFFHLAVDISAIISNPPQPALNLILAGGKLVLTWPVSAAGFILQSTTNLSPPVVWNTVSSAPATVSGQNVVTNSISGPQMFFRLEN